MTADMHQLLHTACELYLTSQPQTNVAAQTVATESRCHVSTKLKLDGTRRASVDGHASVCRELHLLS